MFSSKPSKSGVTLPNSTLNTDLLRKEENESLRNDSNSNSSTNISTDIDNDTDTKTFEKGMKKRKQDTISVDSSACHNSYTTTTTIITNKKIKSPKLSNLTAIEGPDSDLQRYQLFIPLIETCCQETSYQVRAMASKALVALIAIDEVKSEAIRLVIIL
jgi:hypothetical protein